MSVCVYIMTNLAAVTQQWQEIKTDRDGMYPLCIFIRFALSSMKEPSENLAVFGDTYW